MIFAGLPFTLMYNYLSSVLRSLGDSRTPFLFLAFSAVSNIFLDLFCIVVLHWGCAGAAIATITAQAASGILCLIFIVRKMKLLRFHKENRQLQGSRGRRTAENGTSPPDCSFPSPPLAVWSCSLPTTAWAALYVPGFTAGMRIKQFAMCPFDAIGTAASVFCSQNLGAGKA